MTKSKLKIINEHAAGIDIGSREILSLFLIRKLNLSLLSPHHLFPQLNTLRQMASPLLLWNRPEYTG